jgi:hypothetical protein
MSKATIIGANIKNTVTFNSLESNLTESPERTFIGRRSMLTRARPGRLVVLSVGRFELYSIAPLVVVVAHRRTATMTDRSGLPRDPAYAPGPCLTVNYLKFDSGVNNYSRLGWAT